MNRADFQRLTDLREADAKVLFDAGQWSGAYYLIGYAVECGLKACIAKLIKEHDFPDKEFVKDCYTHDIEKLVRTAGLIDEREAAIRANKALGSSWSIVKDWSEKDRYSELPQDRVEELFQAVTDDGVGVLPWIKARW